MWAHGRLDPDNSKELREKNEVILRYFQMQVIKIQPKMVLSKVGDLVLD